MDQDDIGKDFAALECMRKARLSFESRICAASETRDSGVIDILRLDSMFDFAEFYFTIKAVGLIDPQDIIGLADSHDDRIEALLKDKATLRRRGLREDPLLGAIFSGDIRPRLEAIWREEPGSLDQSNLARFLITQMSRETTRTLVDASHAAGFLTRVRHPAMNVNVVRSTGVMEQIFGACLRDMRSAIAQL